MKVEAVIVCVDYADYLSHTLPFNKYAFDRITVVTSQKDRATSRVCEYYHIECVKTNILNDSVNKGKAINIGLDRLSRDGWLVHMDSDIILPPRTRYLLEIAKLKEDTLYGIDRQMCSSYEDFARWMAQPYVNHECDMYLHSHLPFPLGTRLGRLSPDKHSSDLGYFPLGFFQMWYEGGKTENKKIYPENINNYAGSDMAFAEQWTRDKRSIIPEIVGAIHLGTPDQVKMGTNWNNRKSMKFGPNPFEEN